MNKGDMYCLKEKDRSRCTSKKVWAYLVYISVAGITVSKLRPVVCLDTFDGRGECFCQMLHEHGGGISTVFFECLHEFSSGICWLGW